jgi:ParB-like chromosome segregation protein Spo0J
VRKHPERNMATIKASLARFGPARSIVIDQNNVVRAGNGTVEAAIADGLTEAIVVNPKPGQIVAVRRKDWSDTEATAYSIADNRAAELAEWDEEGLASTLESLRNDEFDLDAIGFDEGELDELLNGLVVPQFEPTSEDSQSRLDEKEPVECPKCGHHFVPKT